MKNFWMGIVAVIVGCGKASYRLQVIFPDEGARAKTERVVVCVLSAAGHECTELVTGETKPQELQVLDDLEAVASFSEGVRLGQIETDQE